LWCFFIYKIFIPFHIINSPSFPFPVTFTRKTPYKFHPIIVTVDALVPWVFLHWLVFLRFFFAVFFRFFCSFFPVFAADPTLCFRRPRTNAWPVIMRFFITDNVGENLTPPTPFCLPVSSQSPS